MVDRITEAVNISKLPCEPVYIEAKMCGKIIFHSSIQKSFIYKCMLYGATSLLHLS